MDAQEARGCATQTGGRGTRDEETAGGRGKDGTGEGGESSTGKGELSQVDRGKKAARARQKSDVSERIGIAEASEGDRG